MQELNFSQLQELKLIFAANKPPAVAETEPLTITLSIKFVIGTFAAVKVKIQIMCSEGINDINVVTSQTKELFLLLLSTCFVVHV